MCAFPAAGNPDFFAILAILAKMARQMEDGRWKMAKKCVSHR